MAHLAHRIETTLIVAIAGVLAPIHSSAQSTPAPANAAAGRQADAATTYAGTAQNGAYSGAMRLALGTAVTGTGKVSAALSFSDGLSGEGQLTGTMRGTDLTLEGTVLVNGARYPLSLRARRDASGTLAGTYAVTVNGTPQRASFSLAAAAPAGAGPGRLDTRLVGSWAMVIQGGSWTTETNYGSFTERVRHASTGAPAGALTITADGRYTWTKRSGTSKGKLTPYVSPRGKSGWRLEFDGEAFFAQYVDGRNPGLYLFSPATDFWVYTGVPIR